jgi:Uma2 family endonuclease
MSSLATRLVGWEEFERLPDPDDGQHLELHDGEVVIVPPPTPRHLALQWRIAELLRAVEEFDFAVMMEFPYKPAPDYQFWKADVAVLPRRILQAMRTQNKYELYAPPLIVEVLSPSNRVSKLNTQRVVAMAHGAEEFWVIDPDSEAVHVTTRRTVTTHRAGERVSVLSLPAVGIDAGAIFQ